mgnify:FL=1
MSGFENEIPYFHEITVVPFSAQTFEGVERLREIVEEVISDDDIDEELEG